MRERTRQAITENLAVAIGSVLLAAVLAWLLAGCSSGQPPSPDSPRVLEATLADPPAATGRMSRFTGPTECRTSGNTLPWIWPMSRRPIPWVGYETRLYGTRGTTPDTAERHLFAWVISHDVMAPPLSTVLAPGCWLIVRPDAVLLCYERQRDPTKAVDAWAVGHRAVLSITPTAAMAGRSIYIQLAMHAPGENFAEVLVSQGVELVVGGP